MKWSSRDYLIAFNMIRGIGDRRLQHLLDSFGTLEQAWSSSDQELSSVPSFGRKLAKQIVAQREQIDPIAEQQWAIRNQIKIFTYLDSEYPEGLTHLAPYLPVIYCLGQVPKELGVAVVGTRKPTLVGKKQAYQFAQQLAQHNIPVISGLARGIDTQAHVGALAAKGRTIAVLGSPLNYIYPQENRNLAKQIIQSGCLISEFSRNTQVRPGNFRQRNRIISALSKGVLVVEANESSGALSTAAGARDLGRDVWAIPGEIHHPLRRGTNRLIKDGAGLVETIDDILIGLGSMSFSNPVPLDPSSNSILEYIKQGCSPQEIIEKTGLEAKYVFQQISLLEVNGVLRGNGD